MKSERPAALQSIGAHHHAERASDPSTAGRPEPAGASRSLSRAATSRSEMAEFRREMQSMLRRLYLANLVTMLVIPALVLLVGRLG